MSISVSERIKMFDRQSQFSAPAAQTRARVKRDSIPTPTSSEGAQPIEKMLSGVRREIENRELNVSSQGVLKVTGSDPRLEKYEQVAHPAQRELNAALSRIERTQVKSSALPRTLARDDPRRESLSKNILSILRKMAGRTTKKLKAEIEELKSKGGFSENIEAREKTLAIWKQERKNLSSKNINYENFAFTFSPLQGNRYMVRVETLIGGSSPYGLGDGPFVSEGGMEKHLKVKAEALAEVDNVQYFHLEELKGELAKRK